CLREPYTQTGPRKAVHQALSAAKTPGAVLEAILNATLPTDEPEKAVSTIIGRGGMHGTLRYLEGMGKAKGPLSIELRDRMIKDLRRKLADGGPSTHEDKAETRPSAPEVAVDIEALRKTFAKGPREEGFGRAFLELTRRDPATVAAYLVQWELPAERRPLPAGNSTRGYDLGSLFTHACGKDRPVHLRTLLKAKDPFIRVAGAVYLCFEEPRAGAKELKALQAIEGDPGAWAALTLARRGDASAVPRALQVFAERRKQDAWTNLHHNLCAHLLVLLSNSAASSGLAQPLRPESADAASIETYLSTEDHAQLLKWWDDHKATIQLLDPWMPILEKQKID
ncbi:MAG: hypothetical protein NTV86_22295, partial [Planctomycetota bacterium]|nr:hypothetical protein [Planctomycetota bacterium]